MRALQSFEMFVAIYQSTRIPQKTGFHVDIVVKTSNLACPSDLNNPTAAEYLKSEEAKLSRCREKLSKQSDSTYGPV